MNAGLLQSTDEVKIVKHRPVRVRVRLAVATDADRLHVDPDHADRIGGNDPLPRRSSPRFQVDSIDGHGFITSTADKDRAVLISFLRGKLGTTAIQPGEKLEESLREVLYLVLSTPEYQLG